MKSTYIRTSLPRPPAINRRLGQLVHIPHNSLVDKVMRQLGFERIGHQKELPL